MTRDENVQGCLRSSRIFHAILSLPFSALRNSACPSYLTPIYFSIYLHYPRNYTVLTQSSDPTSSGSLQGQLEKAKSSDVAQSIPVHFHSVPTQYGREPTNLKLNEPMHLIPLYVKPNGLLLRIFLIPLYPPFLKAKLSAYALRLSFLELHTIHHCFCASCNLV